MEDKNNNSNNEEVEILDLNDNDASLNETKEVNQDEIIDDVNEEIKKEEKTETKKINTDSLENNSQKEEVKNSEVEVVVKENKTNNTDKQIEKTQKKVDSKNVVEEANNKTDIEKADDKKLEETPKKEEVTKNEETLKKKSITSIIVLIIVFLLLIGAIFALPYINDYFDEKKLKVNNTDNSLNTNNTNETQDKENDIKTSIDIKSALSKIKDIKSYTYENEIDVYVKDKKEETLAIKNNNKYSFNETKYKVEINKVVADFSYDAIDYYEKINDNYYMYLNDMTTNEYTKSETTLEKFNVIYNIFSNTIEYLINDNEVIKERQIKVDNENHANITLKTNIDILKQLSFETSRIQNKIDISKLIIDNVNIDLYFDKNKDLYKIEFNVEDKNIYQDDIDGEIESAVSKYTFSNFNKIKDIEIPEI